MLCAYLESWYIARAFGMERGPVYVRHRYRETVSKKIAINLKRECCSTYASTLQRDVGRLNIN